MTHFRSRWKGVGSHEVLDILKTSPKILNFSKCHIHIVISWRPLSIAQSLGTYPLPQLKKCQQCWWLSLVLFLEIVQRLRIPKLHTLTILSKGDEQQNLDDFLDIVSSLRRWFDASGHSPISRPSFAYGEEKGF